MTVDLRYQKKMIVLTKLTKTLIGFLFLNCHNTKLDMSQGILNFSFYNAIEK